MIIWIIARFVGALRAAPRSLRLPKKICIFQIGTKSPKIMIKSKGFDLKARVHPWSFLLIIRWEHGKWGSNEGGPTLIFVGHQESDKIHAHTHAQHRCERNKIIYQIISVTDLKAFPVAQIRPNLHKIVPSSLGSILCKFGWICATGNAFVRLISSRNSILNFPAKIWTDMQRALLCGDDS